MSLIRKHVAVLQAWACLALVAVAFANKRQKKVEIKHATLLAHNPQR